MTEPKHTSVRYCPHLGHNVVLRGRFSESGDFSFECLNKEDCGFSESGCRNLLLSPCAGISKAAKTDARCL